MKNLVSTDWLADHLNESDVAILDCSWHMPATNRRAQAEYLAEHIPGARFYDIDANSDQDSPLPHMLPSPQQFASQMRQLGIDNQSLVICYDTPGLFSAARVWWMLRHFGHGRSAVLNGGLLKWKAENHPMESGLPQPTDKSHFIVQSSLAKVSSMSEVKKAEQIADARGPSRFRGEEPEPRPGVKSGHIPGSRNLPFANLVQADGTLKPDQTLREEFKKAGLDLQKPIVTSCGSGVTAAILSLALAELNAPDHSLYDGSWTEWGSAQDTPIATEAKA